MLTAPLRVPIAVGANATVTEQLWPVKREVPDAQDPPRTKSAALAPPIDTPLRLIANGPVLETVIVCAALVVVSACPAKVRALAERLMTAPATLVPLPDIFTCAGLDTPEWTIATRPLRAPSAPGVNVMTTVQVAPAARAVPLAQVPVRVKSLGWTPPLAIAERVTALDPELVTVTVCDPDAIDST